MYCQPFNSQSTPHLSVLASTGFFLPHDAPLQREPIVPPAERSMNILVWSDKDGVVRRGLMPLRAQWEAPAFVVAARPIIHLPSIVM